MYLFKITEDLTVIYSSVIAHLFQKHMYKWFTLFTDKCKLTQGSNNKPIISAIISKVYNSILNGYRHHLAVDLLAVQESLVCHDCHYQMLEQNQHIHLHTLG